MTMMMVIVVMMMMMKMAMVTDGEVATMRHAEDNVNGSANDV